MSIDLGGGRPLQRLPDTQRALTLAQQRLVASEPLIERTAIFLQQVELRGDDLSAEGQRTAARLLMLAADALDGLRAAGRRGELSTLLLLGKLALVARDRASYLRRTARTQAGELEIYLAPEALARLRDAEAVDPSSAGGVGLAAVARDLFAVAHWLTTSTAEGQEPWLVPSGRAV